MLKQSYLHLGYVVKLWPKNVASAAALPLYTNVCLQADFHSKMMAHDVLGAHTAQLHRTGQDSRTG